MHVLKCAAAIPLVLAFSVPAVSQQPNANTNFEVRLEVESGCSITASGVNFGKVNVIENDIDASGELSITCTPGQTYDIQMGSGTHANGSTTARFMTQTGGTETVSYNIYQDSTKQQAWGSDVGTNTVRGTGDGTPQIYTIPATISKPTVSPSVGTYTDTVTATLYY